MAYKRDMERQVLVARAHREALTRLSRMYPQDFRAIKREVYREWKIEPRQVGRPPKMGRK